MIVEWQGLGYNRRAVSLHRAARAVAERGWPDDLTELPGVGPYTAAAVGNFAFGRDVLPVDTNVRRVQERTGESFDAACAQALFDLGATVCLARVPRCGVCPLAAACPSRGRRYEPARKQSPFEGSFRQRRAVALRAVAAGRRRRTTPRRSRRSRATASSRVDGAASSSLPAASARSSSATACAARPSPRPVKPSRSVVVARTLTSPSPTASLQAAAHLVAVRARSAAPRRSARSRR